MSDKIEIRRLAVSTHIGVPDEERATAQTLWISAVMTSSQGLCDLQDDVRNTIDYYTVSVGLAELAAARSRKLIETLAEDSAAYLLANFALSEVKVTVEKQILPNADFVSVEIIRSAQTS